MALRDYFVRLFSRNCVGSGGNEEIGLRDDEEVSLRDDLNQLREDYSAHRRLLLSRLVRCRMGIYLVSRRRRVVFDEFRRL